MRKALKQPPGRLQAQTCKERDQQGRTPGVLNNKPVSRRQGARMHVQKVTKPRVPDPNQGIQRKRQNSVRTSHGGRGHQGGRPCRAGLCAGGSGRTSQLSSRDRTGLPGRRSKPSPRQQNPSHSVGDDIKGSKLEWIRRVASLK